MSRQALALCIGILICATASAAPQPLNIYVSPGGSDQFSGLMARNNLPHKDGPFATIGRAQDYVRGMRRLQGDKLIRPVNIILRGGTYFLPQPIVLTAEDSGTGEFPVTYMAYSNEKPIISAGRPVRGWGKVEVNGREMWAAMVPELRGADDTFHEMWVGGQRRVMARSPNQGFYKVPEVPDLTDHTGQDQGQNRFRFNPGEVADSPDLSDSEVVVMSLWAESHLPVDSVDQKQHLIKFTKPTVFKLAPDDRWFIQGGLAMLDEPGEWCFQRETGKLYYLPVKGEMMLSSEFIIPWQGQIMLLRGDIDQGKPVEHVTFRGITFANSEWYFPRQAVAGVESGRPSSGFSQATFGVPGAIWGEGVRDCVFEDCTITHAGNYGIELGRGCQNNRISYCTFSDLGAGGIKLGTPRIHVASGDLAAHNQISDCTIEDCGRLFPSAVGIWMGQTSDNQIVHNDIHGLWYTGISVGWTWGYGASQAKNNLFEANHVHHIGTPAPGVEPILSDMGAIYTLGVSPGTIIRNNCFHDIAGLRYGGWGIYFDEGSSNILAENNLVYRTTHGGLHQHYGQGNTVRNNIFAFGRDAQIQRSRVEDHLSFTFEKNLVYWDRGALLAGSWSQFQVAFDYNTYWHAGGGSFDFAGKSWDQWRAAGMDKHSQIADPGFIDPEHNDFHLRPAAAKDLLGFVPFDVTSAGPRPRQHVTR